MNKAILKKLVDRHLLLPDLAESVATGYEPTLNEVVSSILTHEIDCEAMTRNNPESTVSFRQACMTRQGACCYGR
jgi:hypothetical protein